MTWIYYNDSEPFVCQWLRNLIAAGQLPDGEVDQRPIQEVQSDELRGFTQLHFFAGIGGWPYALQLAGWGDRPVWTGSCPCQPFSAAGKGQAEDDPRHLWPHWFRLIRECRPERVFGEQVDGAIGRGWFDVVATDLEAEGYAVGAAVLGAHSVGAPHRRQRLWFVADAEQYRRGCKVQRCESQGTDTRRSRGRAGRRSPVSSVADAEHAQRGTKPKGHDLAYGRDGLGRSSDAGLVAQPERAGWPEGRAESGDGPATWSGESGELGNPDSGRCTEGQTIPRRSAASGSVSSSPGFWDACEWLPCRDGKARPTQFGLFPLAHGVPARVGRLRAYGNAIVPQVAATFVRAYMETMS